MEPQIDICDSGLRWSGAAGPTPEPKLWEMSFETLTLFDRPTPKNMFNDYLHTAAVFIQVSRWLANRSEHVQIAKPCKLACTAALMGVVFVFISAGCTSRETASPLRRFFTENTVLCCETTVGRCNGATVDTDYLSSHYTVLLLDNA